MPASHDLLEIVVWIAQLNEPSRAEARAGARGGAKNGRDLRGMPWERQFGGCRSVGLRRRHRERQRHQHPRQGRQSLQRLELIAPAGAPRRHRIQEKWHIGTKRCGELEPLAGLETAPVKLLHTEDRRGCVRGSATQARSDRDPLLDSDPESGLHAQGARRKKRGAVSQIGRVGGHGVVVDLELDAGNLRGFDFDSVEESQRDKQGIDVVIAIGPLADDLEPVVELGGREDFDRLRRRQLSWSLALTKRM